MSIHTENIVWMNAAHDIWPRRGRFNHARFGGFVNSRLGLKKPNTLNYHNFWSFAPFPKRKIQWKTLNCARSNEITYKVWIDPQKITITPPSQKLMKDQLGLKQAFHAKIDDSSDIRAPISRVATLADS